MLRIKTPKKNATLFPSRLLLLPFPTPLPSPDLHSMRFFPIVYISPLPLQYVLRYYAFETDITCDVVRIRRVISKPNFGRQNKTLIEWNGN